MHIGIICNKHLNCYFFCIQWDVVVLEENSLYGVGEEEGSEHTRYCDIESIANSSMMAAPISHPQATAANDFSTVLPYHAGKSNNKSMIFIVTHLIHDLFYSPSTNFLYKYGNLSISESSLTTTRTANLITGIDTTE